MSTEGITLESYRDAAPAGAVETLLRLADRVRGRRVVHVNSTRIGGGVAEILHRLTPLLNSVGVVTRWEVLDGDLDFFLATKALHNALQGTAPTITAGMRAHYVEVNRRNAERLQIDGDVVFVHDPQPAALIDGGPRACRWVWRCHIDLATPERRAWSFLRRWITRYDAAVVSSPAFAQDVPIPQFLIYPSIDPLAEKNRCMSVPEIQKTLEALHVPDDKPMLVQVSRFDRFKDPLGVIRAYQMIKRYHDVRLVLAGGTDSDDPEGAQVLAEVREAAGSDRDIHVLGLPADAHLQINALQRAATIVIQKSLREGFGLTVAEAMWKGKPVIGGATGGIALQVIDGETGYAVHSVEAAAHWICHLLSQPALRRKMGEAAHRRVKEHFLITRQLRDHLALLLELKP
jgi:trehalose synthase